MLSILDGGRILGNPVEHNGVLGPGGAEIPLNLCFEKPGSFAVRVRIECHRAGSSETEVWSAPLGFVEVRPDAAAASGSGSVTINIQGGNAGDFGNLISGASQTPDARYRTIRPAPRLSSSPTRLTLESSGRRLHLLARQPAWFGRQGERAEKGRTFDNAAVLHVFSPDGNVSDSAASSEISRTHFLVERAGSRCRVRDGAPNRDPAGNILPGGPVQASKFGTAVDGRILSPLEAVILVPGETCELALAPRAREGGVFSLRLAALADVQDGRSCAGALLRRADSVPESYLALWGEADLGAVAPALCGHSVQWDGTRFTLRSPDGAETVLATGLSFGPAEFPVRVETFHQIGI